MRAVVGVDLGGTNVRAASYHEDGSLAGAKFEFPSNAQSGTESIIESMAQTIGAAINASQATVEAVGIAVPGHIDTASGTVVWAPNFGKEVDGIFRYWENIPLTEMLQPKVGVPIVLGNDANLAALGEYQFGSGKNSASCLVMLTVGTGIGGGVIMSPRAVVGQASGPLMLVGGNQGGAELGHMVIQHGGLDCNAGTYGAVESYCQRDSIIQRAVHRLRRGRKSVILDMVEGHLNRVTPLVLTEAADRGDEVAKEVWQEVGTYLGVAIGSYINIFSPSIVAVGGQIAKAGHWLLDPARSAAQNVAIPSLFRDAVIVQAEQTEDAGMLGGAALALQR